MFSHSYRLANPCLNLKMTEQKVSSQTVTLKLHSHVLMDTS